MVAVFCTPSQTPPFLLTPSLATYVVVSVSFAPFPEAPHPGPGKARWHIPPQDCLRQSSSMVPQLELLALSFGVMYSFQHLRFSSTLFSRPCPFPFGLCPVFQPLVSLSDAPLPVPSAPFSTPIRCLMDEPDRKRQVDRRRPNETTKT